jgi:hypothetical protein
VEGKADILYSSVILSRVKALLIYSSAILSTALILMIERDVTE